MRICIVGAGAIGAVIGARLAVAGNDVALIARGAHLAAIQARGLTLVDHLDHYSGTYRIPASAEPSDFSAQDLVVIALKAHALGAMLGRIAPLVGPHTVVLPALNGLPWWYFYKEGGALDGSALQALDPQATMFAALDCAHLVGCVVHLAAEVRAPGEVHHTGGRRLLLGEPDRTQSDRLRIVCATLAHAGFEASASADIRLDIWVKLMGNLSFNPVAALTGYLINQICADAQVREVVTALMQEAMKVSAHYGYPMPISVEQRIALARELGAAKISMLQDLEQRRPLELAAIVGAVLELAELAGIALPATRLVHALALGRARALGIG